MNPLAYPVSRIVGLEPRSATPAANTIPVAGSGGTIDYGWIAQSISETSARWAEVCRKLTNNEAVSFAFEGDSVLYGQIASGSGESTIAAINGSSQLRAETPIPETFKQFLAKWSTSVITCDNRGYPGDPTTRWFTRWQSSDARDVTFVNYGLNDCNNYGSVGVVSLADYMRNLTSIVLKRRAAGSLVILCLPNSELSDNARKTRQYRAAMRRVGEALDCPIADFDEILKGFENPLRSDSVHLHSREYALIASSLAAMFTPQGASPVEVGVGDRVSLRKRHYVNGSFNTAGTGIAKMLESGGVDAGTVSPVRIFPLLVKEPVMAVLEVNSHSSGTVSPITVRLGGTVPLRGDGTSFASQDVIAPPRMYVEAGWSTSDKTHQSQRLMVLEPGFRLITANASAANLYISGLRFESPDHVPSYVRSCEMVPYNKTVADVSELNPGTANFVYTLVIGGQIDPNPSAAVTLIDKLDSNNGWKLVLNTSRKLELTIGSGTTTTTLTSPHAVEWRSQEQRIAVSVIAFRASSAYFFANGVSLGSVAINSYSSYSITSTKAAALIPSASRVYCGAFFGGAVACDSARLGAALEFSPEVSGMTVFEVA